MAKVLLVEDDNNLREIYQARLMAEGYDIVAAQNGEEALVLAKQNKPDLIISDVMMPRISGFEMLDILRNTDELKHTKVIMLTALGQAEDQSRADNLGADKYLVKSQVTLEDIVNAAKELLGEEGVAPSAPAAAAAPEPAAPSTPAAEAPAAAPTPVAAEPVAAPPTPEPVAVAPEPVAVAPEPATATAAPAVPVEPPASPAAVPASVVPQPDTTVVVPPAPANPTPPAVTVAPLPAPDVPAAAPAASDPVAPATAPADDAAGASQSLAEEEAALQSQIASFAEQPAPAAPPAVEPASTAAASNDQAIADAVDALNDSVASPAAASTPADSATPAVAAEPAPAPDVTEPAASPAQSVGGTKVIQPLSEDLTTGPNLDELLAKEEAKEAADKPVDVPAPGTTHAPSTPAAETSVDPNNISL